ncbi:MAG: UbiA family prenyltransferase, partial [Flavobacteriia bacterium]|nr:UbiA family prenyltransferase [Flavobacteriia bacterium]
MSFFQRFYIYQKERFPFLVYLFMIGSFSFSAISYSRICRGVEGFVSIDRFLICMFTTTTLFFLLRVFDEFKDHEDDTKYRTYLPVIRGVISLKELRNVGIVVFILQLVVNAFAPQMYILFSMVIVYLLLMGKEFFISEWLKKHQFWYVTSHMLIIPLVDIYASGTDWLLEGSKAPMGLIYFFLVSFMNGIVLEIGRKIKTLDHEEEGVVSYTKLMGVKMAPSLWILLLWITWALALMASYIAGYGYVSFYVLTSLAIICSIPGILFLTKPNMKASKLMEIASGLWTFGMYLTLGAGPM